MVQAALTSVESPRYVTVEKMLPYIKDLLKEYLFSVFRVSASVFECEDKFCLLIYSLRCINYFKVH